MVYCADRTCYDTAVEGKQYCERHSHHGGELTLYYWEVSGRVGAILRMLGESKTPFTWKTEFPDIAAVSSGFGGPTDTFAPPVLKDGDSLISQSLAITVHVGTRTGYDKGISCHIKALQYMSDAYDFAEDVTKHSKSLEDINKFVKAPEAGKPAWIEEWLTNFERSIKGPFYFGSQPTYVDFWTTQGFDWADFVLLNGIRFSLDKYPKLVGMLTATRAIGASAVADKPIGPEEYALPEALATAFKQQA